MNYEIVSIYLKDGRNATGLSGKSGAAECCAGSYEPYAIMMGCQNNGDRAMMVFDLAADSKEEAVNLDKLRLLCRDGAIPVYAAGKIENIEKIKRYLDLGCEKVFLNFRSACGKKLLEEAAGTFGREKLGWYMETPEEVPENGVIPEKEVSMLLLEPAAACVKDRTKLPVLLHEEKRAVCTADNVPAHIYQSAVSWGEFKKNGDGLDALKAEISRRIAAMRHRAELVVPYAKGGVLSMIHNLGQVLEEEYTDTGTRVVCLLDAAAYQRVMGALGNRE